LPPEEKTEREIAGQIEGTVVKRRLTPTVHIDILPRFEFTGIFVDPAELWSPSDCLGDVLRVGFRFIVFRHSHNCSVRAPIMVARCGLPPQITGDRQWLRLW
jgi:hypothetical protein